MGLPGSPYFYGDISIFGSRAGQRRPAPTCQLLMDNPFRVLLTGGLGEAQQNTSYLDCLFIGTYLEINPNRGVAQKYLNDLAVQCCIHLHNPPAHFIARGHG